MHVCVMGWIIRFAQHGLQHFQLCNLSKLGKMCRFNYHVNLLALNFLAFVLLMT